MGLAAAGNNGVKAQLKERFCGAARTYASLGDVRKATGVERKDVVACVDGNV